MTRSANSSKLDGGAMPPKPAQRRCTPPARKFAAGALLWVFAACLSLASSLSSAQTLDSVSASIGSFAITASDVEKEYQFESFLDGQWPPAPATSATLASAREHLTYQDLLTREENPGPAERAESEKSAAARMADLRKEYQSPEAFQRALSGLGMTETEIIARIAQEELMLRLIDQRLRPAASPSDDQVAEYYQSTFVPEFRKRNSNGTPPPLSEVDGEIREILTEKRVNELLDQWIEELKPTTRVRFHSF